jgi:hypothetical protein
MFSQYVAQQYTHRGAIRSAVGLVKRSAQSGIVDRSSELAELAKPIFIQDEELGEDLRQIGG